MTIREGWPPFHIWQRQLAVRRSLRRAAIQVIDLSNGMEALRLCAGEAQFALNRFAIAAFREEV